MPNVELSASFIYYNMFKFQVDWTIIFLVIVYTDTQTDMGTLQLRLINRNYKYIYSTACHISP